MKPTPATPTGWTISGNAALSGPIWISNGGFGLFTSFGDKFLDLTGTDDRAGSYFTVSQSISTVLGAKYSVTFDLGVAAQGGQFSGQISVLARAGSVASSTFTDTSTAAGFTPFELDSTASSTSTLISFTGETGILVSTTYRLMASLRPSPNHPHGP